MFGIFKNDNDKFYSNNLREQDIQVDGVIESVELSEPVLIKKLRGTGLLEVGLDDWEIRYLVAPDSYDCIEFTYCCEIDEYNIEDYMKAFEGNFAKLQEVKHKIPNGLVFEAEGEMEMLIRVTPSESGVYWYDSDNSVLFIETEEDLTETLEEYSKIKDHVGELREILEKI